MNLQGIYKIRIEYRRWLGGQKYASPTCWHWSRCYSGRYKVTRTKRAYKKVHKKALWSRARCYHRPLERKCK